MVRMLVLVFFTTLLTFTPNQSVHAIGLTPPSFEMGEVRVGSTTTISVNVGRSVSVQPTGDISVTVQARKNGARYFSGGESFVLVDGENWYTYTFNIIPDVTASGTCEIHIDFLESAVDAETDVSITGGSTLAGSFTIAGTQAGDCGETEYVGYSGSVSGGVAPSSSTESEEDEGGGSDTQTTIDEGVEEEEGDVVSQESSEGTSATEEADESVATEDVGESSTIREDESESEQVSETASSPVQSQEGSDVDPSSGAETLVQKISEEDMTDEIPKLALHSQSHPRENQWYPLYVASLQWLFEGEVNPVETYFYAVTSFQEVSLEDLVNQTSNPQIQLDVPNGVSYFHVARQRDGKLSEISTRVIRVDTEPPDFISARLIMNTRGFIDKKHQLSFASIDQMSGMDFYQVYMDGTFIRSTTDTSIELDEVQPGRHVYQIRAIDKVGNLSASYLEVFVEDDRARDSFLKWLLFVIGVLMLWNTTVLARSYISKS